MGVIMKIDRSKFREIEALAMCIVLLPVLTATAVKFLYQARKDLRFPNKNDMWE
jgi:hypothetical protein